MFKELHVVRLPQSCSIPIHFFNKAFSPIKIVLKICNCMWQLGFYWMGRSNTRVNKVENTPYYEQYCFIQVTWNINAKGQTWNKDE